MTREEFIQHAFRHVGGSKQIADFIFLGELLNIDPLELLNRWEDIHDRVKIEVFHKSNYSQPSSITKAP